MVRSISLETTRTRLTSEEQIIVIEARGRKE
jgi:hypothetical protein